MNTPQKEAQCSAGKCSAAKPARAKTPIVGAGPMVSKKIIRFKKQFVDYGYNPNKEKAIQMINSMGEQRIQDRRKKPSQVEMFNRFIFDSNVHKLEILENYYISVKDRTKQLLANQANNPNSTSNKRAVPASPEPKMVSG